VTTLKDDQDRLWQIALELSEVNAENYLRQPFTSHVDDLLMQLAETYLHTSSGKDRTLFLELLDEKTSAVLSVFAHRMSMVAVRRQTGSLIVYGLIMLMLVVAGRDRRDATMTLSLLYNSGRKLGKMQELLNQAVSIAPTPFSGEWLFNFSRRDPEDAKIEAMGFREIEGPHGLIYQFGNEPTPEGWL
jgi:hypothetical protein